MSFSCKATVLYGGGLLQVNGEFYEVTYDALKVGEAPCKNCALFSMCEPRVNCELRNLCNELDHMTNWSLNCNFMRYEGVLPPKKTVVVLDKIVKKTLLNG